MEKTCDLLLGPPHPELAAVLKALDGVPAPAGELGRCFNQEEDFFLQLPESVIVPSFDVHHDVGNLVATPEYLSSLTDLVRNVSRQVPEAFAGLTWFFDPRDTLHPVFAQVFSSKDKKYLYLMRLDLTYRTRYAEVLEKGNNTRTPRFRTRNLFLESEVLPLASIEASGQEKRLYLAKLFQNTWKGESGRRYHVEGQWIDQDISKFLTRSVLTPGRRTFPYYPLRCRYNTLSASCLDLHGDGRRKAAAVLDLVWGHVAPRSNQLQSLLQETPFSEELPLFQEVQKLCRPVIEPRLGDYTVESYLNADDQKEYRFRG